MPVPFPVLYADFVCLSWSRVSPAPQQLHAHSPTHVRTHAPYVCAEGSSDERAYVRVRMYAHPFEWALGGEHRSALGAVVFPLIAHLGVPKGSASRGREGIQWYVFCVCSESVDVHWWLMAGDRPGLALEDEAKSHLCTAHLHISQRKETIYHSCLHKREPATLLVQ